MPLVYRWTLWFEVWTLELCQFYA